MQTNAAIDVAIDRENPPPVARIEMAAEHVAAPAANLNSATVLLHVRFRPDTTILNIDECPDEMTNEEWFKRLCARAGGKFANSSRRPRLLSPQPCRVGGLESATAKLRINERDFGRRIGRNPASFARDSAIWRFSLGARMAEGPAQELRMIPWRTAILFRCRGAKGGRIIGESPECSLVPAAKKRSKSGDEPDRAHLAVLIPGDRAQESCFFSQNR